MNNYQLMCALKSNLVTRQLNITVCAANRLPDVITTYPQGFIVNTDNDGQPGEHWISFWLQDSTYGECLDSAGRDPANYRADFKRFLLKHCLSYKYNTMVLQSKDTNMCGVYCLYYIMLKATGYSLSRIQSCFTTDTYTNDVSMLYFATKYLDDCL